MKQAKQVTVTLSILLHLVFGCSAQLTFSTGRSTFCQNEVVTITCQLSSFAHNWTIDQSPPLTSIPEQALLAGSLTVDRSGFVFEVTNASGNDILSSAVSFNTSLVANGTIIQCSSAGQNVTTLMHTVNIFDPTSPPQSAMISLIPGNYTSLIISFTQPAYAHECVTGYRVSNLQGQSANSSNSSAMQLVVPGLNLCQRRNSFTVVALTAGNDSEATSTPLNDIPDFTDLGRVSNVAVVDRTLQWTPPPNAPQGCILSYSIMMENVPGTFTTTDNEVMVSTLIAESNNTIPFCQEVNTIITPVVGVGNGNLPGNSNPPAQVVYLDPDFPFPNVTVNSGSMFDTSLSWTMPPDGASVSVGTFNSTTNDCVNLRSVNGTNTATIPSQCSDVGRQVVLCVVFQKSSCRTNSTAMRTLPDFVFNVATTTTSNSITISYDLTDISGMNCSTRVLTLTISLSDASGSIVEMSTEDFTPGSKTKTFSSLSSNTMYDYTIRITQNGNQIGNQRTGQISTMTAPPCGTTCIIIIIVVVIVIILGPVIIVVITVYLCKKKKKKESNNDEMKLKDRDHGDSGEHGDGSHAPMVDQKMYATPDSIEHETAPSGETYALVEKKKTVQHEEAVSGDLYAVTDKKPKKPNQKSEEELAQMYSVPDKSKKNEGLVYADLAVHTSKPPQGQAPSGEIRGQNPEVQYSAITGL